MSDKKDEHTLPDGATSSHSLETSDGTRFDYVARAEWMAIRRREKTIAEMFYVAYVVAGESEGSSAGGSDIPQQERPVTFVFNGGPGAASAYLHMGAIGPRRVVFNEDGSPPAPPAEIVDNRESWLAFTDLVFIDPIGTGFSRAVGSLNQDGDAGESGNAQDSRETKGKGEDDEEKQEREFFGFKRDLESLCEFIRSFLSTHGRWQSPLFIAGESYGGYRVGKLARMLQEKYGVGLNGALLISPALEFMPLDSSDYDILPWVNTFPTFSLTAYAHGRSSGHNTTGEPLEPTNIVAVRQAAERAATRELPPLLLLGDALPAREWSRTLARIRRFTGLSRDFVETKMGRIGIRSFARELLRDTRRVLSLYDASMSITDPYPDRDTYEGPDAALMAADRVFTAGINTQLRRSIGVHTPRDYHLLSTDVNRQWKIDYDRHALQSQIGATDDLRYGLYLNPHMHVRISHGLFDMVTPYYASERLVANMKLDDEARQRVSLRHYPGGHMFYTRDASRRAFAEDVRELYRSASGQG